MKKQYTWNYGKSLGTVTDGDNTYAYAYDENGIRTSKTVNDITTNYNTKDGVILSQTDGTVLQYPVKQPKKDKRVEDRTVFLLQCGDCYALTKRTENGLLSGLWQLPNILGKLDVNEALHSADAFDVQPVELYKQMHRIHIFTHIKWQMICYHILCAQKSSDFVWATEQEIQTTYALPTAFRMFFEFHHETDKTEGS